MRLLCSFALLAALVPGSAIAQPANPNDAVAKDILKQLIEINTTDSTGNTTTAAEAMAVRLRAAGFPAGDVQVLGPNARKGNLVARLRGRGNARPILLLAHLDVVEARKEDWSPSLDPFVFTERDGYYYGRGTSDDKGAAALTRIAASEFPIEVNDVARGYFAALAPRQSGQLAAYGVDGICSDVDDDRSHGRDERVLVRSFFEGREFVYRLVKTIAGR